MSEKSEAKRISADAYVDQERFQYRMWSEKDGMRNHYGHGFDDGVKWAYHEAVLAARNLLLEEMFTTETLDRHSREWALDVVKKIQRMEQPNE